MPSQSIPGYKGQMFQSEDGTNFTKIAELKDVTLHIKNDPQETTTKDSDGWREFDGGLKDWTATAESLYVESDVGQDALFDALVDNQKLHFRFQPQTGPGRRKYEGTGLITDWELAEPLDERDVLDIQIRGSGTLTKGNQA